jgi:hypothetical protein
MVSAQFGKYCWSSESELKILESVVLSNKITWTTLCPCKSKTDRIGTVVGWDTDASRLKNLTPSCQPFVGHAMSTAPRCRRLNSLMQMNQPIWKIMEKIMNCKKQLCEIKGFQALSLKRESLTLECCDKANTDRFDNEIDWNDFEEKISIGYESLVTMSVRTNPDTVNIETAFSPMIKTNKFSEKIEDAAHRILNEMNDAADEIFNILDKSTAQEHDMPFLPGPVGESPLHAFFLLGLRGLGMAIIKKYYTTPELLSVPYLNDLDPWRKVIDGESKTDTTIEDGLYTGETVLHIAIVKEDSALVTHLLNLGIDISSRAVGVFF